MQIQTERGLITIEAEYQSEERCKMDGYLFSFHAKDYGDIYSIALNNEGTKHSFALVRGFN